MLEFEYGTALVATFAPLEGGREFGALLALEFLDERRSTVREQCADFLCGKPAGLYDMERMISDN